MKKVLKIILIVLVIIVIIFACFLLFLGKRHLKLKEIENKFSKFRNIDNYSLEVTGEIESSGETTLRNIIAKTYYKDGTQKDVYETTDGEKNAIQLTTKDYRITFINSDGEKKFNRYDEQNEVDGTIYNSLETISSSEYFHNLLKLKIETVADGGEKLYKITGIPASVFSDDSGIANEEIYLDYDKGTIVKIIRYYNKPQISTETIIRNYEFGNVTDEDLKVPTESEWLR